MHYTWNWGIFWDVSTNGVDTYATLLLMGAQWTVVVALGSWVIAFVFGSLIGVMRTLPFWTTRFIGTCHVELFRSIPLLVQLFLGYFVLPELLPREWGSWLKQLPNGSVYTAICSLGLFTSARVAEQVRAGIGSLPKGQRMAATALGLTTVQTYRHVLLPIAYRIMLPPMTSEFLNNFKNTATTFTIGVIELMAQTLSMSENTFKTFEALSAATFAYLAINLVIVVIARRFERGLAIPGFTGAR